MAQSWVSLERSSFPKRKQDLLNAALGWISLSHCVTVYGRCSVNALANQVLHEAVPTCLKNAVPSLLTIDANCDPLKSALPL